ncbi:Tim44/TimA family putative adaptor protein [Jhaorihella thermophila]|uniref:Predicted lipid-binding transport protein, Tim44 family n=1 Tax=Jhaorihella thermophila TaxID=488547 RepID=A0A1H5VQI0_9RHOB|nr:Tim44/TimA family putative adaptor protein [Jhaorihella thermophila]SEF89484.1 Predicted lipid-binding transport protein, Tim44 family [Jhaorihella thermophila]
MNSPLIQLLVLAGIAVFLILRLRSVLGTREGFEKPPVPDQTARKATRDFEVIEGGPDTDISDYVPADSKAARELAAMKRVEPDFLLADFVQGARAAYEMIVTAFDNGDVEQIRPFLADDVYQAFAEVVEQRKAQGLTVESDFIGVRETTIVDASFDKATNMAEITVRFVGELTTVVRDRDGNIVEGSETGVKRQKDVWTFAREMGSDDPNWRLIATDE